MFDEKTKQAAREAAEAINVDPAALLAIAEVESGGAAFALVRGRQEPMIRFEGHYFDRRLSASERRIARIAGLASPNAGAVANPASQQARWDMLARAAAIDHAAAHESVSWGLGQVMGAHWQWLGYASVDDLVAEARSGVDGQIHLMARFIEKSGLVPVIAKRDWTAFARSYNGPAFRRNAYNTRIAAAYRRYSALEPGGSSARRLQQMLVDVGLPVAVDGIIGPATKAAIRTFQHEHGLSADGIAGPRTLAALEQAARKRQQELRR